MATYLLTWNPKGDGLLLEHQELLIRETESGGGPMLGKWSIAGHVDEIEEGDSFFMFRQKEDRGVVAAGIFTGPTHLDRSRTGKGNSAYGPIQVDRWLAAPDRLPIEVLEQEIPSVRWIRLQLSGVLLDPDEARELKRLWRDHVKHVDSAPFVLAEEAPATGRREGKPNTVKVNRYERSAKNRAACIRKWGYQCKVCGFDFAETYGELGLNYIHVHHLEELSRMGGSRPVDPVKDMRPVCANCHAMLHRESPALSINQLKRRLQDR